MSASSGPGQSHDAESFQRLKSKYDRLRLLYQVSQTLSITFNLAQVLQQVLVTTTVENATTEDRYHGDWRYASLIVGQREFKASCFSPTPNIVDPKAVGDAVIGFRVTCQPVGHIQLVIEDDKARIDVTSADLQPGPC